jgi:short-subunit dehydrogenase
VPGQTVYGASKAAVKLLTEGLRSELAGTNVRVTVVFPGAIATNIAANSGVAISVGGDAKVLDKLYRLAPRRAAAFIANQMKALLK